MRLAVLALLVALATAVPVQRRYNSNRYSGYSPYSPYFSGYSSPYRVPSSYYGASQYYADSGYPYNYPYYPSAANYPFRRVPLGDNHRVKPVAFVQPSLKDSSYLAVIPSQQAGFAFKDEVHDDEKQIYNEEALKVIELLQAAAQNGQVAAKDPETSEKQEQILLVPYDLSFEDYFKDDAEAGSAETQETAETPEESDDLEPIQDDIPADAESTQEDTPADAEVAQEDAPADVESAQEDAPVVLESAQEDTQADAESEVSESVQEDEIHSHAESKIPAESEAPKSVQEETPAIPESVLEKFQSAEEPKPVEPAAAEQVQADQKFKVPQPVQKETLAVPESELHQSDKEAELPKTVLEKSQPAAEPKPVQIVVAEQAQADPEFEVPQPVQKETPAVPESELPKPVLEKSQPAGEPKPVQIVVAEQVQADQEFKVPQPVQKQTPAVPESELPQSDKVAELPKPILEKYQPAGEPKPVQPVVVEQAQADPEFKAPQPVQKETPAVPESELLKPVLEKSQPAEEPKPVEPAAAEQVQADQEFKVPQPVQKETPAVPESELPQSDKVAELPKPVLEKSQPAAEPKPVQPVVVEQAQADPEFKVSQSVQKETPAVPESELPQSDKVAELPETVLEQSQPAVKVQPVEPIAEQAQTDSVEPQTAAVLTKAEEAESEITPAEKPAQDAPSVPAVAELKPAEDEQIQAPQQDTTEEKDAPVADTKASIGCGDAYSEKQVEAQPSQPSVPVLPFRPFQPIQPLGYRRDRPFFNPRPKSKFQLRRRFHSQHNF